MQWKQAQTQRLCEHNAFLQDLLLFEKQWSCLFISMNAESPLSIQEMSEAQTAEVKRKMILLKYIVI